MPAHRRRKWLIAAAYWLVQALLIHIFGWLWLGLSFGVDGPGGDLLGAAGISLREFAAELADPDALVPSVIVVGVLTLAQAVFLFPVRRPGFAADRGVSLYLSLAVAGFAAALLLTAAVVAVVQAVRFAQGDHGFDVPDPVWWALLGVILLSWSVSTVLLVRFCRRGTRESVLGRIAATLFLGTVVEALATIPLDVMIRRRSDCYCNTGTFLTLTTCGAVGVFALGPAIFLPLLLKRRRRWYMSRCEVCGYDMSGNPRADRCPECGAGWKPDRADAAPAPNR